MKNSRFPLTPAPVLLFILFGLYSLLALGQKSTVVTKAGPVKVETLADDLNHPWGMAFLPDGRLLFTERAGNLRILRTDKTISDPLKGVPEVFAKGQGGLLDVTLDPNFKENNTVYLSYAEPGDNGTAGTALGRGKLKDEALQDFKVIFRMEPKVQGPNHFGGRILFEDDQHLFLTLAERFKFEPAQDLSNHLGTIVRIHPDGSIPQDNPFTDQPEALKEIWSYGHRNIESAAIDPETGTFWVAEMGPMGGDELNLPKPGANYGWPVVSWGDNYDGTKIPDPDTRPEFADAVITWTPTISPSGMLFYTGDQFSQWKGDMFIGGLTSTGLVRVKITGEQAREVERIPLNVRVRDVEQAPDGSLYVLTDADNGKILQLKAME